jgi:hypothetical protein
VGVQYGGRQATSCGNRGVGELQLTVGEGRGAWCVGCGVTASGLL